MGCSYSSFHSHIKICIIKNYAGCIAAKFKGDLHVRIINMQVKMNMILRTQSYSLPTFFTVPAAPAINFFPTAVEPVNVIFLT